jgi:hypothetical protein
MTFHWIRESKGLSVYLGPYWVACYLNPRVWAIDGHAYTACCALWVLFGPFEFGRMQSEEGARKLGLLDEEDE